MFPWLLICAITSRIINGTKTTRGVFKIPSTSKKLTTLFVLDFNIAKIDAGSVPEIIAANTKEYNTVIKWKLPNNKTDETIEITIKLIARKSPVTFSVENDKLSRTLISNWEDPWNIIKISVITATVIIVSLLMCKKP